MRLARTMSSFLRSANRAIANALTLVFSAWAFVLMLQAAIGSRLFDGWPAALVLFAALFVGWFPAVFVHELGHALVATAMGWRVWIISVGPFTLRLRPKPTLVVNTALVHDGGGYVLTTPKRESVFTRTRSIAISAAGPIISIGAALFVYPLALAIGENYPIDTFAAGLLTAFSASSLASAAITTWPHFSASGRPNDAMTVLTMLRRWFTGPDIPLAFGDVLAEHRFNPEDFDPWIAEAVARTSAVQITTFQTFMDAVAAGQFQQARSALGAADDDSSQIMHAYLDVYADGDADSAERRLLAIRQFPTRWGAGVALRELTIIGITAAAAESEGANTKLNGFVQRSQSGATREQWDALIQRARAHIEASAITA